MSNACSHVPLFLFPYEQRMFPCSLVPFSLFPQDCPPTWILIFGGRDSHQKTFPAENKKCSKYLIDCKCAVTRRRTGLNHLSQHLRHWLPARDNQASGPGPESPSFRSKVYAALVKTCARRDTSQLHALCAQRTSLRSSDSPDKAQHLLCPPKLRIPIPCYTSYKPSRPLTRLFPG